MARAWLVGGVIALTVGSVLERRFVPAGFAAITLGFNLVLLLISRWTLSRVPNGE